MAVGEPRSAFGTRSLEASGDCQCLWASERRGGEKKKKIREAPRALSNKETRKTLKCAGKQEGGQNRKWAGQSTVGKEKGEGQSRNW